MNPAISNTAALAGRILLALIFLLSGWGKITGYDATAAAMAGKGLPMVGILLPLSILIELGGALLLVIGFKARWAALWLFLWMIPVTLMFHAFWGIEPKAAQAQQIHFMKNLAIMGGLLMVFALGPGAASVDNRR